MKLIETKEILTVECVASVGKLISCRYTSLGTPFAMRISSVLCILGHASMLWMCAANADRALRLAEAVHWFSFDVQRLSFMHQLHFQFEDRQLEQLVCAKVETRRRIWADWWWWISGKKTKGKWGLGNNLLVWQIKNQLETLWQRECENAQKECK